MLKNKSLKVEILIRNGRSMTNVFRWIGVLRLLYFLIPFFCHVTLYCTSTPYCHLRDRENRVYLKSHAVIQDEPNPFYY
jgi:hypothetical protein